MAESENEIVIRVENVIIGGSGEAGAVVGNGEAIVNGKKIGNLLGTFSVVSLMGAGRKLVGSIQNEQLSNTLTAAMKVTKYTLLATRAATGDPTAILSLGIDTFVDAKDFFDSKKEREQKVLQTQYILRKSGNIAYSGRNGGTKL